MEGRMSYAVKEIFYTLQGEGGQAGRPAVFCRFAGCNLWSGLEADRDIATCTFCDTDFVGTDGENGGKFSTAEELADKIAALWPDKDALVPMLCLRVVSHCFNWIRNFWKHARRMALKQVSRPMAHK